MKITKEKYDFEKVYNEEETEILYVIATEKTSTFTNFYGIEFNIHKEIIHELFDTDDFPCEYIDNEREDISFEEAKTILGSIFPDYF